MLPPAPVPGSHCSLTYALVKPSPQNTFVQSSSQVEFVNAGSLGSHISPPFVLLSPQIGMIWHDALQVWPLPDGLGGSQVSPGSTVLLPQRCSLHCSGEPGA
jgi:hypothetical protein